MIKKNEAIFGRQIKNVFSVFIALLPVLSIYYSGIPGVNVADVILSLFLISIGFHCILFNRNKVDISYLSTKLILGFCLFVLIHVFMSTFIHKSLQSRDIFVRSSRILFYLISAIILLPKLIITDLFLKSAKAVAIAASIFLLIQVLMYKFDRTVLKGFLSFFPLYSPEYDSIDYKAIYQLHQHRPTSFFLEPAHFSRYAAMILPFVLIDVLDKQKRFHSSVSALLITISVLLSTSSIGIALVGLSWFVLIIVKISEYYRKRQLLLIIILFIISIMIPIILVAYLPTVRYTIGRSINFTAGSAFDARLGSAKSIFEYNNGLINLVLGNGYGHVPVEGLFMTGIIYLLHGTGMIGTSFVLFIYFEALMKKYKNTLYNAAVMITLFLLFVDDSFNSIIIVFIFSIHYCVKVSKKE